MGESVVVGCAQNVDFRDQESTAQCAVNLLEFRIVDAGIGTGIVAGRSRRDRPLKISGSLRDGTFNRLLLYF